MWDIICRDGATHVHVRLYELAKENETKPAEAGGTFLRRRSFQRLWIIVWNAWFVLCYVFGASSENLISSMIRARVEECKTDSIEPIVLPHLIHSPEGWSRKIVQI
jgi:hypothetical protein